MNNVSVVNFSADRPEDLRLFELDTSQKEDLFRQVILTDVQ